ncbi:hypothetical protein [Dietzia alimentaria]|uniref:hypothetical protein n=1 Tax=Dietzia alimentaria TaxID=665550 RepID=UPI00029A123E|nr:hypothetical protein [Dietzia alimentaria]
MSNPARKRIAQAVADAIEQHKYEIQGLCACGTDLGAAHGQQKAAYRKHTTEAVTDAVWSVLASPASVDAVTAHELRTANLIAYLDYMTRVGVSAEIVGDLATIVSTRVIHGLGEPNSDSTKGASDE